MSACRQTDLGLGPEFRFFVVPGRATPRQWSRDTASRPGCHIEFSRKDVVQLRDNEEIELLMRFRDMKGGYPMHCHNTVHEDHQMMLLWQIADVGDNNTRP